MLSFALTSAPGPARELRSEMMNQAEKQSPAELWPGASTPGWDAVDEAGWESFPASDPPALVQDRGAPVAPVTPEPVPRKANMSVLDETELHALHEALNDEYQAWATYDQVIADFGPERPFINVREAEARHIEALRSLFQRYGVPMPENTWPGRVPRFASPREACLWAIDAEVANGALFDRLSQSTRRSDILAVFRSLQRASQERHLLAFRRCATRGAGRGAGPVARRG